jgi:hypothetical protein
MKLDRCNPNHRSLFAFVLLHNLGARKMFRALCNLGATNIYPDTMLHQTGRNRNGSPEYDRCIDPGAWHASCRNGIHVALIRHSDGEWLLHS